MGGGNETDPEGNGPATPPPDDPSKLVLDAAHARAAANGKARSK
jgi:hypothetical protein